MGTSAFDSTISRIKQGLNTSLPGFEAQNRMAPSFRGGSPFRTQPDSTTGKSAVLIGIYPQQHEPTTILIKRTTYNGAHSGQVSFPGGKYEKSDESLTATALREAYEEVGLPPSTVKVIGNLTPLFIPVTNLLVQPVVGVISKPPALLINKEEVEYPIFVNLMDLKNPGSCSAKLVEVMGTTISAPCFLTGNEFIWGATAMIISELICLY
ncbi:MAG TPA: CoA pyrophosphatase [Tenuifilaceae bacterium]|nr:CoA pyrophosphatase [Tenuifilaceae bacterium]